MEIKLDQNKAIKLAEKQTNKLADDSRIKVISGPTFEKAKGQLIEVKRIKKLVKEQKESITKPLNEALKNARLLFKPNEDKIATIEKYLNSEVMTYNQKLLAEQKKREDDAAKELEKEEEKKRKAEKEAQRLKDEQATKEKAGEEVSDEDKQKLEDAEKEADKEVDMDKITKKADNTAEKIDKIRTRKVTRLRVTDKTKIPFDFLEVNEVELKKALTAGEQIKGAELYTEEIPVNSY